MIATEISQLEQRLAHEKAFVQRQPLLRQLWKLRHQQTAADSEVVAADAKNSPPASEMPSN